MDVVADTRCNECERSTAIKFLAEGSAQAAIIHLSATKSTVSMWGWGCKNAGRVGPNPWGAEAAGAKRIAACSSNWFSCTNHEAAQAPLKSCMLTLTCSWRSLPP